MADFTSASQGQGQVSGPAPSGGVADTSGAVALGGVATMASIFANDVRSAAAGAGSTAAARAKLLRDQAENSEAQAMLGGLSTIAAAVDSGDYTPAQGRTASLALVRESVGKSVDADGLAKTANAFLAGGLGSSITEKSVAEKALNKSMSEAIDAGYVDPNSSKEAQAAGHESWRSLQAAQQKMAEATKVLEFEKAQREDRTGRRTETESIRSANEELAARNATSAFREITVLAHGRADTSFNAVMNDPNLVGPAKSVRIEEIYNELAAEYSEKGKLAPAGELQLVLTGLEHQKTAAMDRASGKISKEYYENTMESYKHAMVLQSAQADPEIRQFILMSELELTPVVAAVPYVQEAASNILKGLNQSIPGPFDNTPPPPVEEGELSDIQVTAQRKTPRPPSLVVEKANVTQTAAVTTGLKAITATIGNDNKGLLSEAGKLELTNTVRGTLLQAGNRNLDQDEVANFNPLIKYLGDTKTGGYIAANKAAIGDEALNASYNLLKETWDKQLFPIIKDTMDLNRGTRVVFNGNSVSFKGTNYRSKSKLNRTVAPLLNNWIRAMVHTAGSTDYAKVWADEIKPVYFKDQAQIEERFIGNILNTVPEPEPGMIIGGWQFLGGDKNLRESYSRPGGRNKGELGIPVIEVDPSRVDTDVTDFDFEG